MQGPAFPRARLRHQATNSFSTKVQLARYCIIDTPPLSPPFVLPLFIPIYLDSLLFTRGTGLIDKSEDVGSSPRLARDNPHFLSALPRFTSSHCNSLLYQVFQSKLWHNFLSLALIAIVGSFCRLASGVIYLPDSSYAI
jgi:hypothetical protein